MKINWMWWRRGGENTLARRPAVKTGESGGMGILVCHVSPEVARQQIAVLKLMGDESATWNAILNVTGVMQREITRRAISSRHDDMSQAELLACLRGVGLVVAELDALRKGVDGQFVRAEKFAE